MNSSPPKRLTLTRVAGEGRQPLRDGVDQAVADRMTERVVDALEVVEVEHGEAAAGGRGRRPAMASTTISWK